MDHAFLEHLASLNTQARPNSVAGQMHRRSGVRATPELARVKGLPRREWQTGLGGNFGTTEDLVRLITETYRRPGGSQTARPMQAASLAEIHDFNGGLIAARVGSGKTLVTFLASRVLQAKRPLLLIPAKLRDKTKRDWLLSQTHWVLPEIRTESYDFLSRVGAAHFLENLAPDLIIADECHRLKNPRAAVTRRVKRYLSEHPGTKFVGLSGTITRKSLHDYHHLLHWALGDQGMPLPAGWGEMSEWAECLDVQTDGMRLAPGALVELCTPEEQAQVRQGIDALSVVRGAYRRRLTDTPGVVSTLDSQVACSLSINELRVDIEHMGDHFERMRQTWETPDEHPFTEAVELWRHARELSCGYFYVWDPRPPADWLIARKRWSKFVRGVLSHSRKYDSELQVAHAVSREELSDWIPEERVFARAEWTKVRDTFRPNSVARWLDGTVAYAAAKWLTEGAGIAWVESPEFGEALSKISGAPYFGAGGKDARGTMIEDCTGPCIASIAANGEGRNLQQYNRNLVTSCPPSGSTWEQMLGRTHRDGQEADEVSVDVILACKEQLEGFHKAIRDAQYIQETTGQGQKLLYADVSVSTLAEGAARRSALWRG